MAAHRLLFLPCIVLGATASSISTDALASDFSLTDAKGRDLVSAALNHKMLVALAPTTPLQLRFRSHGKTFEYDLHRAPSTLAPGAAITVVTESGSTRQSADESHVYKSLQHDATLSMVGDSFHGLVKHGNMFFDVNTERGLLRVKAGNNTEGDHAARYLEQEGLTLGHASSGITNRSDETKARLWRRLNFGSSDTINKWTSCYDLDHVTRAIKIGCAIGSKLASRFANEAEASEWLQSVVAKATMIYQHQMNMVIQIGHLLYQSTHSGAPSWDQGPDCPIGIDTQLSTFDSWDPPEELAVWHLFDDCFPGAGTIGLAYVGTMCRMSKSGSNYYNTGVNWYSGNTWKTFAHELGHNFGAEHSFEHGLGSTGGIMDYGDGKFEGYFQFNSPLRKEQVCATINSRIGTCSAITTYAAECGNGIIEDGEDCECTSGTDCRFCCDCKLDSGKQCTPDSASATCCDSTGLFKTPTTMCTASGASGFCDKGSCVTDTNCYGFVGFDGFCGLHDDNQCKMKCVRDGSCLTMNGWSFTSNGVSQAINWIPDGTSCIMGSMTWHCQGGVCTDPTTANVIAPTVEPTVNTPMDNTPYSDCVGYDNKAFYGIPDLPIQGDLQHGKGYTRDECNQACLDVTQCRSWSFGVDDGHCELWTPHRMVDDLSDIPGYETYICASRAVGAAVVDCDEWANREIAGKADLGCPSCEAKGVSNAEDVSWTTVCGTTECGGFSLTQCDTACKETAGCHAFTFGSRAVIGETWMDTGYCELWSSAKGGEDLRRPDASRFTTYICPCRGEGKICQCLRSNAQEVRIGCSCANAADNDCAAGKYCWADNTCNDGPSGRRLSTCAGGAIPTPVPTAPTPRPTPAPTAPPPTPQPTPAPTPSPPGAATPEPTWFVGTAGTDLTIGGCACLASWAVDGRQYSDCPNFNTPWCFVAQPQWCGSASASASMPGHKWAYCVPATPAPTPVPPTPTPPTPTPPTPAPPTPTPPTPTPPNNADVTTTDPADSSNISFVSGAKRSRCTSLAFLLGAVLIKLSYS